MCEFINFLQIYINYLYILNWLEMIFWKFYRNYLKGLSIEIINHTMRNWPQNCFKGNSSLPLKHQICLPDNDIKHHTTYNKVIMKLLKRYNYLFNAFKRIIMWKIKSMELLKSSLSLPFFDARRMGEYIFNAMKMFSETFMSIRLQQNVKLLWFPSVIYYSAHIQPNS